MSSRSNINAKANLIWEVATKLVGVYKPHEYGKVILPMTVLKRFDDILKPTKQKVLDKYEEVKNFEVKDAFLTEASGYSFYNTSKYDFERLLSDPDNIERNFNNYINGFSDNVIDILSNFKFNNEIKTMADNRLLYVVIEEFNSKKAYMGLDEVKTEDMGYIFEELVRKFSESYDEEAGAHFTARDIIYLMTDLLVSNEDLTNDNKVKTIYDMAMGTSQMLACMTDRIHQLNSRVQVDCYGQELNPETYAIAKADMLIKGGDADNFKQGDTLDDDQFKGYKFDYIISNPPFGIDWKKQKKAVEDESNKGENGRFPVGTPKISDGQMLFTLNGIAKLKDTGKMAIIQNGSPLFSGAAGSGESEIRRYIIGNDWLEAIIQLPTDLFYNTGISTYIWVINKNKENDVLRHGKVQLIDASSCYVNRRKNIGNKRKDLDENARNMILKAYSEFANNEYKDNGMIVESKIFDNSDFGYRRITVESPLYDENNKLVKDNKGNIKPDTSKRDYENIPVKVDVNEYFNNEVLPYNKEAWIDEKKTQLGYEIPFTRHFYKYVAPEDSEEIENRIRMNEREIMNSLEKLFKEV